MKRPHLSFAIPPAAFIGLVCALSASAAPAGSSFTYQGSLSESGAPVTGDVPMEFRLFDASTDGTQVGPTLAGAVDVADGLFTTSLDFGVGSYDVNQALWLEITVDGDLLGRQALEAAPFALNTRGIDVAFDGTVGIGTRLEVLGDAEFTLPDSNGSFSVNNFGEGNGIASGTRLIGVYEGAGLGPQERFEDAGTFWDIGLNPSLDFVIESQDVAALTVMAGTRNVGIGTTSPERPLHVRSTSGSGDPLRVERLGATSSISVKSFPNSQFATPTSDWVLSARDNGNAMQGQFSIDTPGGDPSPKLVVDGASNNVGFNTPLGAQPQARLDISSIGNGVKNVMAFSPANVPQFFLQTDMDGNGGSTDRMYVARGSDGYKIMTWDVFGRVGIGVIEPATALEVNGVISAAGCNCPSSRDLKRDILTLGDALGLVDRLRPVTYTWNEKAMDCKQGTEDIGFIAEEVAEILPNVVSSNDDGQVIGMDYSKLTPVAIQAIKELKAENDELKARLDRLEALLAD